MLWSITHDGQIPDNLEIWYLGVGVRKTVSVPTDVEIQEMESKLHDLWHEIKGSDVTIEDCPPIPRKLRGFAEGGVKIEDPGHLDVRNVIGLRFVLMEQVMMIYRQVELISLQEISKNMI